MSAKNAILSAALVSFGVLGFASGASQQEKPARPSLVFVALYERGPAWIADKPPLAQPSIPEHSQHLRDLGELRIGAAPFTLAPLSTEDKAVGMVVLFAESLEEAQLWLDHDPAIVAGVMVATLRRWHVDSIQGCFG